MNFHEKSENSEFYSIYKIIGFGAYNNFSISSNNINGLLAWITGSYIIIYDISTDSQILTIKNINNKIFSCVKFNNNGKFLISGEDTDKNGEIYLYEIYNNGQKYNYKLIMSYKNHLCGIDKIFFFNDDKYLLSIGSREDKLINVMDIKNKIIIYTYKFNNVILGIDLCDEYAVICGNNFIKIYEFNYKALFENQNSYNFLIKKQINLNKLNEKIFIYVSLYFNNKTNQNKIFVLTEDCYLVEIIKENLDIYRWINLKVPKCFNLTIWENKIGIGCSDGVYKIYEANNLNHILSLPKPPPINPENKEKSLYPDIICNLYNKHYNKLITVYSNRYFCLWNIKNMKQIEIMRHHFFQSGSIKYLDLGVDNDKGIIKMVTAGNDNNVFYWNFLINEFLGSFNYNINNLQNNDYTKYNKHIFHLSDKYNKSYELTGIKMSFDFKFLFITDSIGKLSIFSLENNYNKIIEISAHNNRINTIDYISIDNNKKSFLATGSSDHYMNIYDITKISKKDLNINDFNAIFKKMNSELTNIKFFLSNKKVKLIVSELTYTITIFQLENGYLQQLKIYDDINLNTYCFSNIQKNEKILSGHEGKILIWNTDTNNIYKNFEVLKDNKPLINYRITGGQGGAIFAVSNEDKIIRIISLDNGKLLFKIEVVENISNIMLILDDNFLIVTSIEGHIYFYKLNKNYVTGMNSGKELNNSVEEKNMINNKLTFLKNLIENDVNISRTEKIRNFVDEFQLNEDINFDDIKKLDKYVYEKKNQLNIKSKNAIKLKEEKINKDKELVNFSINKEQNIKNNNKNVNKYKKVKNKISINNSDIKKEKNANKIEKIKIMNLNMAKSERKKSKSPIGKINNISPKKYTFEINKTEIKGTSHEPLNIIIDFNNENIEIRNINSNNNIKYKFKKNSYNIYQNCRFSILKQNKRKNKKYKIIKSDFQIINNRYNNKEKLVDNIKNININNIYNRNDLVYLEKKLELLRDKIRLKLNIPIGDKKEEKLLDTFGALLIDKINNSQKK